MGDTAEERFRRLLLLVPYVIARPGVKIEEICEKFQVSRSQLIKDLEMLFLCGLPGYGPGELIEAYADGEEVIIRMADYLAKPLRLTAEEGLLLYSGAHALRATGETNPALDRAIDRLKEVLGDEALSRIKYRFESSDDVSEIRSAIERSRRIHIVYQSSSREEVTERDVDPWALFVSGGHWYLVGWCHRVSDERIFRVDRMRDLAVLDETADMPEGVDLSKYDQIYVQAADAVKVVLELAPEASWVIEQYPLDSQTKVEDGWTRIELTASGTAWLERLLLRLGPHARVIAPLELAEAVKQLACTLSQRYAS